MLSILTINTFFYRKKKGQKNKVVACCGISQQRVKWKEASSLRTETPLQAKNVSTNVCFFLCSGKHLDLSVHKCLRYSNRHSRFHFVHTCLHRWGALYFLNLDHNIASSKKFAYILLIVNFIFSHNRRVIAEYLSYVSLQILLEHHLKGMWETCLYLNYYFFFWLKLNAIWEIKGDPTGYKDCSFL